MRAAAAARKTGLESRNCASIVPPVVRTLWHVVASGPPLTPHLRTVFVGRRSYKCDARAIDESRFLQRAAMLALQALYYSYGISVRLSVRHTPVLCQNDGT